MSGATATISIVIRVRNERANLRASLGAIRDQLFDAPVEIVVVDNESSDGSPEVARAFGAKVVDIPVASFTWGRALNHGIREARGAIVVLLSADALPADDAWLSHLAAPFTDDAVAAAYGRQLPRDDAPVDERVRLAAQFPPHAMRWDARDRDALVAERALPVSNACAAIRRSVWERFPYDETVAGAEDLVWTRQAIDAGYAAAYAPDARVYHSHREPVMRHAWRLWELFVRGRAWDGKPVTWRGVARAAAAQVRQRCRNCLRAEAPARVRCEGLWRLPFEVGAFALAALGTGRHANAADVRRSFWR